MRRKQQVFVEEYLKDFNATQAAIRAGYSPRTAYSIGPENLKKPEVEEAITKAIEERAMGKDEDLLRLAEQARATLAPFFKLSERETEHPLPTEEILSERKEPILGNDVPVYRTIYQVRSIVLNLEALLDPDLSRLVKKFTDSPKTGLSVELHDAQAALVHIGKHLKLFTDKHDVDLNLHMDGLEKLLDQIYGDAQGGSPDS